MAITKVLQCDVRGCTEHVTAEQYASGWFLVIYRSSEDGHDSVLVESLEEWEVYTSALTEPHKFACCFTCLTQLLSDKFAS